MFKTPLSGKLEGKEVNRRIQAPDLPGAERGGSTEINQ